MKKNIVLLFALISLSVHIFAQPKQRVKTETEINALLCHKWEDEYMEVKGTKHAMDNMHTFLTFKSDHTLIAKVFMQGKNVSNDLERWSYDHSSMTLSVDEGHRVTKFTIIKITDTELVLSTEMNGMKSNMGYKRKD